LVVFGTMPYSDYLPLALTYSYTTFLGIEFL